MDDFITFDDIPDLFSSAADSVGSGLSEIWKTFTGSTPDASPTPDAGSGTDPFAEKPADSTGPGLVAAQQQPDESSLLAKIQTEFSKGADNFKGWYDSLTKDDQSRVAQTIKTGAEARLKEAQGDNTLGGFLKGLAGAGLSYSAQQEKIKAERESEERKRQDMIRRGQVQPFAPGTYAPAPLKGGLVASTQGGK